MGEKLHEIRERIGAVMLGVSAAISRACVRKRASLSPLMAAAPRLLAEREKEAWQPSPVSLLVTVSP